MVNELSLRRQKGGGRSVTNDTNDKIGPENPRGFGNIQKEETFT